VQYKNISRDDFQWNQMSCQHLFRPGAGMHLLHPSLRPRLPTFYNEIATTLVLVTVGLGHMVYRKLYTLIGNQRAEKCENHWSRLFGHAYNHPFVCNQWQQFVVNTLKTAVIILYPFLSYVTWLSANLSAVFSISFTVSLGNCKEVANAFVVEKLETFA